MHLFLILLKQWLSPDGCVMVSIQLHIPLASRLGQRLSLIQHLVGTAMVNTIVTLKGYEVSTQLKHFFFLFLRQKFNSIYEHYRRNNKFVLYENE